MAALSQFSKDEMDRSLRVWIKGLSVWHVCGNASCCRARACRGEAIACWRRNMPRLPEGVRVWWLALMQARKEGVPFDDAIEDLHGTPAGQAFAEWTEAAAAGVQIGEGKYSPVPALRDFWAAYGTDKGEGTAAS